MPDAELGPDGRYIYTCDPDARMGWRSAKSDKPETFCGYDAHIATDVPTLHGPVAPHLARGLTLVPAGTHKAEPGLCVIDAAIRQGPIDEVFADGGYNCTRAEKFMLPAWTRGLTVVVDLHSTMHRGTHPGPKRGTVWIDGTLFSECLPDRLRDLPAPANGDTAEKQRVRDLYDRRSAWAFTPLAARDADGYQRLKGPGVARKVRTPKIPATLRKPHNRPTAACDGKTCGCAVTVTVSPDMHPNARNPMPWGTNAWYDSYHRRSGIESTNRELKTHRQSMHRGDIRGFGLGRYTVLLAFALAGMNIGILRDWHAKRGRPDPWGALLGEPHTPPPKQKATRARRRTATIADLTGHPPGR